MRVHVVRDGGISLGRATWVELIDDMAFYLSADGASPSGVRALEAAWRAYIDAGAWTWLGPDATAPPGPTLTTRYWCTGHVAPTTPVLITWRENSIKGFLSDQHFHPATVAALTRLTNECAARGWYAAKRWAAA